ncbi:hypothetical protein Droror1_Dr00005532 [Drosera rotundifolia]
MTFLKWFKFCYHSFVFDSFDLICQQSFFPASNAIHIFPAHVKVLSGLTINPFGAIGLRLVESSACLLCLVWIYFFITSLVSSFAIRHAIESLGWSAPYQLGYEI